MGTIAGSKVFAATGNAIVVDAVGSRVSVFA
jgi:hypothetical protein